MFQSLSKPRRSDCTLFAPSGNISHAFIQVSRYVFLMHQSNRLRQWRGGQWQRPDPESIGTRGENGGRGRTNRCRARNAAWAQTLQKWAVAVCSTSSSSSSSSCSSGSGSGSSSSSRVVVVEVVVVVVVVVV